MLYQNTTWTKRRWIHALTVLFLLITLGFGGAECFKYFPSDLQSQKWQAEHFHRQAIEIKTCIQNRKGAIATLSPHYVIEAGLDVYREFATGPFIYRVGNLLSAQALKKYRGVSGGTLDTFFANSSPLAILVGHYPDHEARFINWAENHGYKKIYLQKSDLILYLKQSG
jgi:hypothetical protein